MKIVLPESHGLGYLYTRLAFHNMNGWLILLIVLSLLITVFSAITILIVASIKKGAIPRKYYIAFLSIPIIFGVINLITFVGVCQCHVPSKATISDNLPVIEESNLQIDYDSAITKAGSISVKKYDQDLLNLKWTNLRVFEVIPADNKAGQACLTMAKYMKKHDTHEKGKMHVYADKTVAHYKDFYGNYHLIVFSNDPTKVIVKKTPTK